MPHAIGIKYLIPDLPTLRLHKFPRSYRRKLEAGEIMETTPVNKLLSTDDPAGCSYRDDIATDKFISEFQPGDLAWYEK